MGNLLFLRLPSYWLCSLIRKCLLSFCYNGSENRYAITSSCPERRIFWFAVLLNKGCTTFLLLNPLWCAVLFLSVLSLSPRENEVFYDVVAVVDPLTREAQKMSPLLIVSCILLFVFFSSLLHRFLMLQGHFKITFNERKGTQSLPRCRSLDRICLFSSILTWWHDKMFHDYILLCTLFILYPPTP